VFEPCGFIGQDRLGSDYVRKEDPDELRFREPEEIVILVKILGGSRNEVLGTS